MQLPELLALANQDELSAIRWILCDIINRRADKATGEIKYGVVLSDGGLRERTVETKLKIRDKK